MVETHSGLRGHYGLMDDGCKSGFRQNRTFDVRPAREFECEAGHGKPGFTPAMRGVHVMAGTSSCPIQATNNTLAQSRDTVSQISLGVLILLSARRRALIRADASWYWFTRLVAWFGVGG